MPTAIKVARNPKIGDQLSTTLNTSNYVTELELTDSYLVTFANSSATPLDAETANDGTTAIPAIGSTYSGSGVGASLICVDVQGRRRTQKTSQFEVTVKWKNIPLQGSGDKWNINISIDPVTYEQDAWVDTTGKAIQNSASDFMNPTLKRTYYDEDISLSFDCGGVAAQAILNATGDGVTSGCKGHYNSSSVTMTANGVSRTFPAKSLLYTAPRYSTIYTGQPPYDWKFELCFRYRMLNPDGSGGWVDQVADRGRRVVDSVGPPMTWKTPRDKYGVISDGPVLLDGGNLKTGPLVGGIITPTFITFDMFGPGDFTALLAGIS